MTLSPRDRLIVTIAVAAIIVIALVALLIYPQFQQLGSLNGQVVIANEQAQAAKNQLAVRQAFKDRAIETDAKWLRLMNQVPDTPDLPSLIIELQDVAFAQGVQVVGVTPASPAPEGAFQSIPMSLEILGTWADTVNYLQALMKTDRGIRLVGSNMKVTSNDAVAERRNSTLPPYSVDSIIQLKSYMIPSAGSTTTPVPVQ